MRVPEHRFWWWPAIQSFLYDKNAARTFANGKGSPPAVSSIPEVPGDRRLCFGDVRVERRLNVVGWSENHHEK
jgi:hypothetical protein